MIFVIAFVGLGLLALPGALRAVGRRVDHKRWSKMCATALVGGVGLFEAAALLAATPLLLRALGLRAAAHVCQLVLGNLSPGGLPLEVLAGVVSVALPTVLWQAVIAARGVAREARVESSFGDHQTFDDEFELVVLPLPEAIAVSVPGNPGQVVMSQKIIETLTPEQFEAVCAHEVAHLLFDHARYVQLAVAVERAFSLWPPADVSAKTLRLALERWADEAAAGSSRERRSTLRSALMTVADSQVSGEMAAFTSADGVMERVEALEHIPTATPPSRWCAVLTPGIALGVTAIYGLAWCGVQTYCVIAMGVRGPA